MNLVSIYNFNIYIYKYLMSSLLLIKILLLMINYLFKKEDKILFKDTDKTVFQKKNYEQLYIDFGHKGISPIICSDCGMPYNPSIQEDDIQHQNYHNIIIDGIEYNVKYFLYLL